MGTIPESSQSQELEASFQYFEDLYRRPIMPAHEAGLRRIHRLLELLGSPHDAFPSIHVTGTCGKGSTTTMIASIYEAGGYQTGIFRSPHIETYRERIAINGSMVSEATWLDLFSRVVGVAQRMENGEVKDYDLGRLSLFEMVWAMAALHFAEQEVDIVVAEVGIGGRLSPTNVLNSTGAVITNIGLDHTAFLGPTVVDIAREKAQIIKTGNCVSTAATQGNVLEVIEGRVADTGSLLWRVGEQVRFEIETHDLGGVSFSVVTPRHGHANLRTKMLGQHQVANAATAISLVDQMDSCGFPVSGSAIAEGMASATLPARLEIVAERPLVLIDGARNVSSAETLANALRTLLPNRSVTLLIGVLGDKDARGIIDVLGPLVDRAVVTQPPWEGRQGDLETLVSELQRHVGQVVPAEEVDHALDTAIAITDPEGLVLVGGSLYLAAAVRKLLLGNLIPDPVRLVGRGAAPIS